MLNPDFQCLAHSFLAIKQTKIPLHTPNLTLVRMPNFVTKYLIFCELWEKMIVPGIKNLGLLQHVLLLVIMYNMQVEVARHGRPLLCFVVGNPSSFEIKYVQPKFVNTTVLAITIGKDVFFKLVKEQSRHTVLSGIVGTVVGMCTIVLVLSSIASYIIYDRNIMCTVTIWMCIPGERFLGSLVIYREHPPSVDLLIIYDVPDRVMSHEINDCAARHQTLGHLFLGVPMI